MHKYNDDAKMEVLVKDMTRELMSWNLTEKHGAGHSPTDPAGGRIGSGSRGGNRMVSAEGPTGLLEAASLWEGRHDAQTFNHFL